MIDGDAMRKTIMRRTVIPEFAGSCPGDLKMKFKFFQPFDRNRNGFFGNVIF